MLKFQFRAGCANYANEDVKNENLVLYRHSHVISMVQYPSYGSGSTHEFFATVRRA